MTQQNKNKKIDFRKQEIILLTMRKGKVFKIRKKIDKLFYFNMNNCG